MKRDVPMATPERMQEVGRLLKQMQPAFNRTKDTSRLKIRFMHLAKALPIKHDGNVYAIHAELIWQCAKDIIAADAGLPLPRKVWKKEKKK